MCAAADARTRRPSTAANGDQGTDKPRQLATIRRKIFANTEHCAPPPLHEHATRQPPPKREHDTRQPPPMPINARTKPQPTRRYTPTDIRQHGTLCAAALARTRRPSTAANDHQCTDKNPRQPTAIRRQIFANTRQCAPPPMHEHAARQPPSMAINAQTKTRYRHSPPPTHTQPHAPKLTPR